MIEWNKVTWYSRIGAILFCGIVMPCLFFSLGEQYGQQTAQTNLIHLVENPGFHPMREPVSTSTGNLGHSESSTTALLSVPPAGLALGAIVQRNASPDSLFVAVSESDTSGNKIVFIENATSTLFTNEYCGAFVSWVDNSKIKVLQPAKCNDQKTDLPFFLHTDGTWEPASQSKTTTVIAPDGSARQFAAVSLEEALQLFRDCKVQSGIEAFAGNFLRLKDGTQVVVAGGNMGTFNQAAQDAKTVCGFVPGIGIE